MLTSRGWGGGGGTFESLPPFKKLKKYKNLTVLCGHKLDTDNSLLRTVLLVPVHTFSYIQFIWVMFLDLMEFEITEHDITSYNYHIVTNLYNLY